jgi:DNA-binding NarL/FixJ family response regulator
MTSPTLDHPPASVPRRPDAPVRLALAEESQLVCAGLQAMLAPYDDLLLVPRSRGGGLATFVDLTLHDSFRGRQVSIPALTRLASRPAGGALVVYTWNVEPALVSTALRSGARGCLSKALGAKDLVDDLRRIHAGEVVVDGGPEADQHELADARLTPRETEVLSLIAGGLSNLDIARATALSINSIKSYIRAAYRKIGVTTRTQAVLWAVRHGCVADPVALAGLRDGGHDEPIASAGSVAG